MEEVASARQKFHCPACGAEAIWNPAKQALICPFCGAESPATLQTRGADTLIVEHDLAAALRAIPDSARGWQAAKTSVRCQSCQAISVFDPDVVGKRCDCAQQVPGDTYRNLVVNAAFSDQTFKHILAPVWLLTYVYGAKSFQVVVNGVTGAIAGSRPWSWIKVTLLVLVLLFVFLLVTYNS